MGSVLVYIESLCRCRSIDLLVKVSLYCPQCSEDPRSPSQCGSMPRSVVQALAVSRSAAQYHYGVIPCSTGVKI